MNKDQIKSRVEETKGKVKVAGVILDNEGTEAERNVKKKVVKVRVAKTHSSYRSIKLVALTGIIASLLGVPVVAWSAPVLLADSYVSADGGKGDEHGPKGGDKHSLTINARNTGFLKFGMSRSLPIGVIDTDIDKATLTVFISKVHGAGNLTIRRVIQGWTESTIPANGISPALGEVGKTFKINKDYEGRWVELDVTNFVRFWAADLSTNNGLALIVEDGSSLDATIDSKENTSTSHQALLDVVLNSRGPTGATGAKGNTGAPGTNGMNGVNGSNGADGLTVSVNGVTQVGGAITLTHADLGLGNIDNTSDAGKPVSAKTLAALDLKAALASPTFTGTPSAPTALAGTGTNQLATTAFTTDAVAEATKHGIGDSYGGGKVFYVYDGGRHGLIAATSDQNTGIPWFNGTNRLTGTTGNGVDAGTMNTTLIIATQIGDNPTGDFAAKICADASLIVNNVIYGDWYLPSKNELNLLYQQKEVVGNFGANIYWSSTESTNDKAWSQGFGGGNQEESFKSGAHHVRAVRAF